jgi:lysophospholipase L1-like esterase
MTFLKNIAILILFSLLIGCSAENNKKDTVYTTIKNYKYLALGDSYTYGQSVCETYRFPEQLKDSVKKHLNSYDSFSVKMIAQTGWTTTNLKSAIAAENLSSDYDLVTLLIGVNNQYQHKPFSLYEQEFPELVNQAIGFVKGNKNNLIVVSIPDYAYTPYGNGNTTISTEIDAYNTFAENYCNTNNITFINITDITRLGLLQPELVAADGLHPSTLAYSKFVARILPKVKVKLGL